MNRIFATSLVILPLLGLIAQDVAAEGNRNSRNGQGASGSSSQPPRGGPRPAPAGPVAPAHGRDGGHSGGGHPGGGRGGDYRGHDNHHDYGGYRGGRSHTSFGLYLGGPVYADPFWSPRPWGFYDPYYYQPVPRTVIIEREPPVYIQRDPVPVAPAPSAPPAPQLWYYCPKPAGYYPYVPQCEQQWVPVNPASLPPTTAPR